MSDSMGARDDENVTGVEPSSSSNTEPALQQYELQYLVVIETSRDVPLELLAPLAKALTHADASVRASGTMFCLLPTTLYGCTGQGDVWHRGHTYLASML